MRRDKKGGKGERKGRGLGKAYQIVLGEGYMEHQTLLFINVINLFELF